MRTWLLTFTVFLCAYAQSEATYNILNKGKKVGTAQITREKKSDGSFAESTVFTLSGKGNRELQIAVTVKADGRYESKVITSHSFPGFESGSVMIVVLYDGKSVQVEETTNGKERRAIFDAPPGKPLAAESALWFITRKPAAGAKSTYYDFDPFSHKWQSYESTYAGPRSLEVNKKKWKAHRINKKGSQSIFVDNDGYPLLTRIGSFTVERVR